MRKSLIKISTILFFIVLILSSLNCGNTEIAETSNSKNPVSESPQKEVSAVKVETREAPKVVEVPTLANKSSADFDKIFGKPIQITEIKDNPALMPGEYRLYTVSGHPKGLSVRFFKDKAKRFNLILGMPLKSSNEAILEVFKINVGKISPDKNSEPLSEKWKGKFNGINFATVYAKREKLNGDFTMVHAEIEK